MTICPFKQGIPTCDSIPEPARINYTIQNNSARPGDDDEWERARKFLHETEEPRLPFSGADFIARGITEGRAVGEALCDLQARWIEAGFPTDPARLARLLDETSRGTT